MLKITYTETAIQMERLNQRVEDLITQRVVLSLRTGQRITVQTSTASFLVSTALPQMTVLEAIAARLGQETLSLAIGDSEFTEVCVRGHWIGAECCHTESHQNDGILIIELPKETEMLVFDLWQASQRWLVPQTANFRQAS